MKKSTKPPDCGLGKDCKDRACKHKHPCFHCGKFGHRTKNCNLIHEIVPCKHEVCINHLSGRKEGRFVGCGGVGTFVVTAHEDSWIILAGMERWGDSHRKEKYNLFTGRVNPEDNNCVHTAAIRELREESKIHAEIDHRFMHNGKLSVQYFGGTPVILMVAEKVSAPFLNLVIDMANNNPETPDDQREILNVRWITLDGHFVDTKEKAPMTPFFNQVRKSLNKQWNKANK